MSNTGIKGICKTVFVSQNEKKWALKRLRYCFYAYIYINKKHVVKRFLIDKLGEEKALKAAIEWRQKKEEVRNRLKHQERKKKVEEYNKKFSHLRSKFVTTKKRATKTHSKSRPQ